MEQAAQARDPEGHSGSQQACTACTHAQTHRTTRSCACTCTCISNYTNQCASLYIYIYTYMDMDIDVHIGIDGIVIHINQI